MFFHTQVLGQVQADPWEHSLSGQSDVLGWQEIHFQLNLPLKYLRDAWQIDHMQLLLCTSFNVTLSHTQKQKRKTCKISPLKGCLRIWTSFKMDSLCREWPTAFQVWHSIVLSFLVFVHVAVPCLFPGMTSEPLSPHLSLHFSKGLWCWIWTLLCQYSSG